MFDASFVLVFAPGGCTRVRDTSLINFKADSAEIIGMLQW
jgi:hypothetical protein